MSDPWIMTVVGGPIDREEVRRALGLLVDPAHHVQIQALPSGKWRHLPGSDLDGLVRAVADMGGEKGTYFSLNPFKGPLDHAVRNSEVIARRWFLVDPDARKAEKDASTSDEEKEAARQVTEAVRDALKARGWPDPIYVDSGNNWQLLYRIDLPNDKLSQQLLSGCLKALGKTFDTERVEVDKAVHDARRICKIPGTWVRKGQSSRERPWRMSRLMSVPMVLNPVPIDLIKTLAGLSGTEQPQAAPPTSPKGKDPWPIKVGADNKAAYARAVLEREVGKVATATEPGRNSTLHDAAWRVAARVAEGGLDEQEARSKLEQAGYSCGLGQDGDPHEIQRAIRNGFDYGLTHPWPIPERPGKASRNGAPHVEPKPMADDSIVVQGSVVVPRVVNWLWPNRVPRGFITIFAGRTGLGKSFVTLDIAARVTRGDCWPDSAGECVAVGNVLIISEDPHDFVLAPRLIELGADMTRAYFMTWEAMMHYTLADTELLGRAFTLSGDPTLIVIDPPTNFLGDVDEHKNAEVRSVLMVLVSWITSRTDPIAMILITHVNKQTAKGIEAVNRVIGSIAWVSTARIAHSFAPDPNDPTRVLFSPSKTNLGVKAKSLPFRIVKTETFAKVEWFEAVDTDADQAMSGQKKVTRGMAAVDWLADRFRERREWRSEELKVAAVEAGISKNALWSAEVRALPIVRQQHYTADGDRFWTWTAAPDWPDVIFPTS